MNDHPICIALSKRGLSEMMERIAAEHHVTVMELVGRVRLAHIVRARADFWLRLRDLGWSWNAIANIVDRDHTTVRQVVMAEQKRRAEAAA